MELHYLKLDTFIIVLLRNLMAVAEFDNICFKCFKAKLTKPRDSPFRCSIPLKELRKLVSYLNQIRGFGSHSLHMNSLACEILNILTFPSF